MYRFMLFVWAFMPLCVHAMTCEYGQYLQNGNCISPDMGYYATDCDVPGEYTQLEYLESSGSQYIDSGVVAADDVGISADFYKKEPGDQVVVGGVSPSGQYISSMYINSASNMFLAWNGYNNGWSSGGVQLNKWYQTKLNLYNDRQSIVDGENYVVLNTPLGASDAYSLYLFALWWGDIGVAKNNFIGRVSNIKISKGNSLIRDFVPARRDSDSVLGMYDIVNHVFYVNQGSGEFVAGPSVSSCAGQIACTNAPENSVYTGAGHKNDCPWRCGEDFGYTSSNLCMPLCGAGITRLNTSSGVTVPLFQNANTAPSIHIKNNNGTCYADLVPGMTDNAIHVNYNGVTYHTVGVE